MQNKLQKVNSFSPLIARIPAVLASFIVVATCFFSLQSTAVASYSELSQSYLHLDTEIGGNVSIPVGSLTSNTYQSYYSADSEITIQLNTPLTRESVENSNLGLYIYTLSATNSSYAESSFYINVFGGDSIPSRQNLIVPSDSTDFVSKKTFPIVSIYSNQMFYFSSDILENILFGTNNTYIDKIIIKGVDGTYADKFIQGFKFSENIINDSFLEMSYYTDATDLVRDTPFENNYQSNFNPILQTPDLTQVQSGYNYYGSDFSSFSILMFGSNPVGLFEGFDVSLYENGYKIGSPYSYDFEFNCDGCSFGTFFFSEMFPNITYNTNSKYELRFIFRSTLTDPQYKTLSLSYAHTGINIGSYTCDTLDVACYITSALSYLFVPSDSVLDSFNGITFSDRIPFSYIYDFDTLWTSVSSSSASSASLDFDIGGSNLVLFDSDTLSSNPVASSVRTFFSYALWILLAFALYKKVVTYFDDKTNA